MRQKNVPTSPVTAETSTRIAAKCARRTVIWAATGLISITTGVTSDTIGVTFGKTATTETKLTRVGEGGEETRRFFSLEELRKLSFRPSKANGEGPGVVCSARPCHTDCAVPKQQDWGKTL